MKTETTKCPQCTDGFIRGYACPGFKLIQLKCDLCGGTGNISTEQAEWVKIGLEMKEDRRRRNQTLRQEAAERRIKPSELAEMEAGKRKPVRRARGE